MLYINSQLETVWQASGKTRSYIMAVEAVSRELFSCSLSFCKVHLLNRDEMIITVPSPLFSLTFHLTNRSHFCTEKFKTQRIIWNAAGDLGSRRGFGI